MAISRIFHPLKENGVKRLVLETFRRLIMKSFCPYIAHVIKTEPLNDNVIVFQSRPDYSDNGKALSEYMIHNGYGSKYKLFWLVEDRRTAESLYPNAGVTFLQMYDKFGSYNLKTLKVYLTAKYVIATHVFYVPKNQSNPNQKRFLLWHGCGYKDKGWVHYIPNNFDKVCVSGPLFIEPKMKYWNIGRETIVDKGYPRYDWLLHPSSKAKAFADLLKQSHDKLLIWMPTFRNADGFKERTINSFPLVYSSEDWRHLDCICGQYKVQLLLKFHIYQKPYNIDFESLSSIKLITNDDFQQAGIELYEFIQYTDGLISDYSSMAFDYLLVNKPIAFALDDYHQYKSTRGFVFDTPLDYMPGKKMYVISDLFDFIKDCADGVDEFWDERLEVKSKAIHQSENYSREIIESFGL